MIFPRLKNPLFYQKLIAPICSKIPTLKIKKIKPILELGRVNIHPRESAAFVYIKLGSHQWIQGYLRKNFCWFSREVFELQTNPIPIFASSFQELSHDQILTLNNSTADITQSMILSHLFDLFKKIFVFGKFWNLFPPNIFI